MELVYVASNTSAPVVVDGIDEVEAHGFAFNTSVAVFSTRGERMVACYGATAVVMNDVGAVFSEPAFTHYHRQTDGVYACTGTASALLYWSTADMNARNVAEATSTVGVYGSAPSAYRMVGFVVGTPFLYIFGTEDFYLYMCDVEADRPEWKVVAAPGSGVPYRLDAQFVIHDLAEDGVPILYTSVRSGAGIYSGRVNSSGIMVETRFDTTPEDGFDTADPDIVSRQGLTTRGAIIGAGTKTLLLGGDDSRTVRLGTVSVDGDWSGAATAIIVFVCVAILAIFVTIVVMKRDE
jgi:hypothetical protein